MTNADLFTSEIGRAYILMNVLEDCVMFFGQIFILSKNKGIQAGALLKMLISFPSMEKFEFVKWCAFRASVGGVGGVLVWVGY